MASGRSLLVVQELLINFGRFAVVEISRLLLLFLRHLPKGAGDLRGLGYACLPHTNTGELD